MNLVDIFLLVSYLNTRNYHILQDLNNGPHGIAVDSHGNVYVGGYSNNVFKITPDGVITQIIDSTGDGIGNTLQWAIGITVDGSDNVYVVGLVSHNAFKITPAGVITKIIDAEGDGSGNRLDFPRDIAVDGSGNVYVNGGDSNNLFKITPDGIITEILVDDGTGYLFSGPWGMAVDGYDNLYVTSGSNTALKITPGGIITKIIDFFGDGIPGHFFDHPSGITVDIYGNVYVSAILTANVFKIAAPEIPKGKISGKISVNSNSIENVLVKLLDEFGLPLDEFDDVYSDINGEYSFIDVPVGDHQVMIVEPLGYISDGNPKTTTVGANETSVLDFYLAEVIIVNNARNKGYWKHQFDVYVKGKGNAQETEEDLNTFISEVHNRYEPRFNIFVDETSFEDWQNVLSVKGNAGMEAKAKSHIGTLALNIMSQKIAQHEIVTEDNYTAADVLTYTSELLLDSDPENDELAKDLAELVNEQQTIPTGQVHPSQDILYKHLGLSSDPGVPTQFNLHQNYPNPFNPSTTITFDIPKDTFVSLKIYDISGRVINQLVNSFLNAGHYNIEFNGSGLSSGIYYYELTSGDFRSVKKLVLTK